jgi:hypothetical protein
MQETSASERAARFGFRLAEAVVGASFVAVLVYVVTTFHSRILWGTEGALLFDASRFRAHLPLWVEPAQGAWDYGPVPARFYAAYTGVWAYVLSLFPESWEEIPARGLSLLGWYGLIAWIAASAPPSRRRATVVASLFVAGTYSLALFAREGRPDGPAVFFSGLALARAVRHGRVGIVESALFAAAAFIKPNEVGLSSGALAAEVLLHRRAAWPAVAGGAVVSATMILLLGLASGGQWLHHLTASIYAPPNLALWLDQAPSALQFFGVPLTVAGYCAWRGRREPGAWYAIAALVSSVAWALFTISKPGAARNYWMEPGIAAIVVFSCVPVPEVPARRRLPAATLAVVQAFWMAVGSVRSSIEAIVQAPAERAVVDRARSTVGARPGEVVLGDNAGVEWMLNHRLVQTPIYMTVLGRAHRYPVDLWVQDASRPEVVGLVSTDDLLERPIEQEDVNDSFLPELRRVFMRRFVLVERRAGIFVYGLRERNPPS